MNKIDFDSVFPQGQDGRSEDVQFVYDFAIDQQKKGILDDVEILRQCANHLADQSKYEASRKIISTNEKISKGIRDLGGWDRTSNLRGIAEHAMEERIAAYQRRINQVTIQHVEPPEYLTRSIAAQKLILAAMREGWNAYEEIFTPEFLAKHGWVAESKEKK